MKRVAKKMLSFFIPKCESKPLVKRASTELSLPYNNLAQ